MADWMVELLVSSGAWPRDEAEQAAPRLVASMAHRPTCGCGGRNGRGCRLTARSQWHGTRWGYRQGCGCRSCRRANAEYIADWRARH